MISKEGGKICGDTPDEKITNNNTVVDCLKPCVGHFFVELTPDGNVEVYTPRWTKKPIRASKIIETIKSRIESTPISERITLSFYRSQWCRWMHVSDCWDRSVCTFYITPKSVFTGGNGYGMQGINKAIHEASDDLMRLNNPSWKVTA
jgi:hypothetical protein